MRRFEDPNVDKVALRNSHFLCFYGQRFHSPFCQSTTTVRHRAKQTLWSAWCALQRSKIHNGLIIVGSARWYHQLLSQCCKFFLARCAVNGSGDAKIAREHPIDVAIYDSRGEVVSKRTDGSCCVVANAFQFSHPLIIRGETTLRHNLLSCCVKIPRARIISQTFPKAHHLIFGCCSQCLHRGKAFDETQIIVVALRNTSLLEDDF